MEFTPISEIIPHLYLGSAKAAGSKALLNMFKITHVVCCAGDLSPSFPGEYSYLTFDFHNDLNKEAFPMFQKAREFIDEGIEKGNVLVHW